MSSPVGTFVLPCLFMPRTVRVLLGLVVLVAAWLAHWLLIETKACCPDSLDRSG